MTTYGKHPRYIVRQQEPFNGGAPLDLLVEHELTPTELFFARNHGNVPEIDAAAYRLQVSGLVHTPESYTLAELLDRFDAVEATATLQCAGNRRGELIAHKPIPNELPWGAEAISNATWRGVRLSDVLKSAGLGDDAAHVEFIGLDETERHGERFNFGGSIPLSDALTGKVLLAFEMNGEPLQPLHGYPLRVVAPGIIGARSVKWLQEIRVQAEPSFNYFQRKAYRLYPPDVTPDNVVWDTGQMLNEGPLTSVICTPLEGEKTKAGAQTVRGYSFASGANTVAKVELSTDGGLTWAEATFDEAAVPGVWRLWQAKLTLPAGKQELIVRATDSSGFTQPAEVAGVWNFKGYMNTAWHRQTVQTQGE